MPKVSVIIPAYNCSEYISESIDSVLNQSYNDFEIIVIDDGSTDNIGSIIKPYLSISGIKYYKNQVNTGLPAARNKGIRLAQGELIAFLDADDIFLKNKLLKQVSLFERQKLCNICYTNELYFKDGFSEEIISPRYHFQGDIFYYLKRSNFIPAPTVMVKKGLLMQNMFDESLKSHEDWDLFLRLSYQGIKFWYVKEPLTKIRIRSESMTIDSNVMDISRRKVGETARQYWAQLKKGRGLFSKGGQKAIIRYLKFKTIAGVMGFPYEKRFNRPVPHRLLSD